MIPFFQVYSGLTPILIPLVVFFLLNSIQQIIDDFRKAQKDASINNNKVIKLGDSGQKMVTWSQLYCGDVVRVLKQEIIPADLLLISSSDMKKKQCFISTENLDGQNNIKTKQVIQFDNQENQDNGEEGNANDYLLQFVNSSVKYSQESPTFSDFKGVLQNVTGKINVNEQNLILRGSVLESTEFIYGVVLYVGPKTKIIMYQSGSKAVKKSNIDIKSEQFISVLMLTVLLLSVFAALFYILSLLTNQGSYKKYFSFTALNVLQTLGITFIKWLILLSNMVPISLYFTLELVRFVQGLRLQHISNMVFLKYMETKTSDPIKVSPISNRVQITNDMG